MKRFRVLTLQALGQGMADAAVAYRYEIAARPKGLQWEELDGPHRGAHPCRAGRFEQNWMDSLADINVGSIAVGVTLAYIDFRMPDFGWRTGRPKLAAWHEGFCKRDSMVKTVSRRGDCGKRCLESACPQPNFDHERT